MKESFLMQTYDISMQIFIIAKWQIFSISFQDKPLYFKQKSLLNLAKNWESHLSSFLNTNAQILYET